MANCRAHRGRGRNEQISGNELRPGLAHHERRRHFYVRHRLFFSLHPISPFASRLAIMLPGEKNLVFIFRDAQ